MDERVRLCNKYIFFNVVVRIPAKQSLSSNIENLRKYLTRRLPRVFNQLDNKPIPAMQALQKNIASCIIYWLGDWLYPITILLHSHVVNMINNTPSYYFHVLSLFWFGAIYFMFRPNNKNCRNGWIFSNKKCGRNCVSATFELNWAE